MMALGQAIFNRLFPFNPFLIEQFNPRYLKSGDPFLFPRIRYLLRLLFSS